MDVDVPVPWIVRMVEEQHHRDDERRPLREGRTPPAHLAAGDIEYRPCPYLGGRYHHERPMNVSALKQTGNHLDDMLDALATLRVAYAEQRGGYEPDALDVWRVSQLGSALPWWYVLRGEPLPAAVAALSKATLGTGILAQRMLVKVLAERWEPPPLTAEALVELAEQSGTMIGETEVCAASPRMLHVFMDALVDLAPTGRSAELRAALPEVMRFGACYANFKLALWIHYLARRFVYADLAAALAPAQPPELTALLDAPCEPMDFVGVEPGELAELPLDHRAYWFRALAELVVPLAPGGEDRPLLGAALAIADALGDPAPRGMAELLADLQVPAALPPAARETVARALATFARIDAAFAAIVTAVEAGFRGAPPQVLDAAIRDRLHAHPPRRYLRTLAPAALPALELP